MSVGLAVFLYTLRPTGGDLRRVTLSTWLLGIGVTVAVAGVALWLGARRHDTARAVYLSVATGIGFGLTAALIKGVAAAFSEGLVGVLTAWQTYVVIVVGPVSTFLLQNTLQSGRLVVAQPGLTLVNPVVAVAWGVAIFSEDVRTGAWLAGACAGVVLIAACTILLSRSPLLHGQGGRTESSETVADSRPADQQRKQEREP